MSYSYDLNHSKRKKTGNRFSEGKTAQKQQLPNSLIMRVLDDETAEREADTLSKGVSGKTEEDLKEYVQYINDFLMQLVIERPADSIALV